jgi:flagellum-specific peptidoglycan hydrolase FlgJ
VFNREPKPSSEELEVSINIPDSLDVAEKTVEPLVEEVIPIAEASIAPVKERMTAPTAKLSTPATKKIIKRKVEVLTTKNEKFSTKKEYLQLVVPYAKEVSRKYGIPVGVILGQAVLESNWGKSKLSKETKNQFGMKCNNRRHKNCCGVYSDDKPNDKFRKFNTIKASFMAYGELLQGRRYSKARKQGSNYRLWAYELKRAGYATNPHYTKILIKTIEDNNLDQY